MICPSFSKGELMTHVLTAIGRLAVRTDGQDLIEYGLLAALIAVFAIAGVTALGDTIYTVFWRGIGQAL
jgi:Flp pilus assembly pilin Flp